MICQLFTQGPHAGQQPAEHQAGVSDTICDDCYEGYRAALLEEIAERERRAAGNEGDGQGTGQ